MVQNQLINTQNLYESLLQRTYHQQQPNINVVVQPSANNVMNMSYFNPAFDHLSMQTTPSTVNMDPPQYFFP